jgi:hypothetical protein
MVTARRQLGTGLLLAVCALLLQAAGGCKPATRASTTFRVERTSPDLSAGAEPVLLNDALTIYFSAALRPLSVTPGSVRLVDEQGHQVPGALRVGERWVTFVPEPPLAPELDDGSYRPGARYRLVVAGYPRPDALRAADGAWLEAPAAFDVRIASLSARPAGLPAPLRPPPSDLPFALPSPTVPLPLAADAPRLRLHFTLPVLPPTVTVDAFEVVLLRSPLEVLRPRSVRLTSSRADAHPGCVVEIDLGSTPRRLADDAPLRLVPGDWISVAPRPDGGLTDLAGRPPFCAAPPCWHVVEGATVPLAEWTASDALMIVDDGVLPGFESRGGWLRPRVRVEAGDGSLGVFRPQVDTVLRPGTPFDRGDGTIVLGRGASFPFLAVDIPPGVVVRIDATAGPVEITSCGAIRMAGELVVDAPPASLPPGRFQVQPVRELVVAAPVALVAAGPIDASGVIRAAHEVPADGTALLLASATRLWLRGTLPFQTMLVVESAGGAQGLIEGARGQSRVYAASFTPGVAPRADFVAVGATTWRQLPFGASGAVVRLEEVEGSFALAWQTAFEDAVVPGRPDLARLGRWQPVHDGDPVPAGDGAFVRFEVRARVRDDGAVPRLRELRLTQ